MTKNDIINIFGSHLEGDIIKIPNGSRITINDFLVVAGFFECEPTKSTMLEFDGGVKGYKELIEQGNFTQ